MQAQFDCIGNDEHRDFKIQWFQLI